jgi:hypothetical protein
MKRTGILQIKQHAVKKFRYLLTITACLFVLVGIQWFEMRRDKEIARHSYHGSYLSHQDNIIIKANLSFDMDSDSAWLKLAKVQHHLEGGEPKTDVRYIKLNSKALWHQSLIMASIRHDVKEGQDSAGRPEQYKMLPIGAHYINGRLMLIVDEEEVYGDKPEKMVFIMSKDR